MSRENVEIVRSGYEAWECGDFEAVFQMLDPEIEWKLPEGGINTGSFRGHQAVRGLLVGYLEAFDYFRIEPERFFETNDRVVVFVRSVARGRGSGAEVEIRPAHLWTMRAGKAVRLEIFPEWEREKALQAVGLSTASASE